ncbi:MAG TPA: hypothetical protein DCZ63_08535 [Geobacter sp.]|nr:hypothetical protein [Geobacter sp.]
MYQYPNIPTDVNNQKLAGAAVFNPKSGLWEPAPYDPLVHYKRANGDSSGDPAYHGFTAADGSWFIMKMNLVDENERFARGMADFPTAWANRASLGYNYFHVVF